MANVNDINKFHVFGEDKLIATQPPLTEAGGKEANLPRRVKLKGFNDNSHFFVDGILKKPNERAPFPSGRYVSVDLPNSRLYLLVSSLSKRLLLPEEDIRTAAAKGTLEALIQDRSFLCSDDFLKFNNYDQTFVKSFQNKQKFEDFIKYYNGIIHKYVRDKDGYLTLAGKKLELSESTLRKVVFAAWKNFPSMSANEEQIIKEGNHKFIISKRDNELQIVQDHVYSTISPKGNSSYGSVDQVLHVSKGIFAAYKIAQFPEIIPPNQTPAALKIKAEVEALNKEDSQRVMKQEQIMLPLVKGKEWAQEILTVVDIKNGAMGHVSIQYSGNLHDWINAAHSLKERIDCCKQLMKALNEMSAMNIAHFDLKGKNIFVDMGGGGKPKFRIGDWGSARRLAHPEDQFTFGAMTEEHRNPLVEQQLLQLRQKKQKLIGNAEAAKQYQEAAKQYDLYAMGVLIFQIIFGNVREFPYGEVQKYPLLGKPYDPAKPPKIDMPIRAKDLPKDLVSLACDACALMPVMIDGGKTRPMTAADLAEAWAKIEDPKENPIY